MCDIRLSTFKMSNWQGNAREETTRRRAVFFVHRSLQRFEFWIRLIPWIFDFSKKRSLWYRDGAKRRSLKMSFHTWNFVSVFWLKRKRFLMPSRPRSKKQKAKKLPVDSNTFVDIRRGSNFEDSNFLTSQKKWGKWNGDEEHRKSPRLFLAFTITHNLITNTKTFNPNTNISQTTL